MGTLIYIVFKRLLDAGLTLRDMKCHIGMSKVQYLGHVFLDAGMSADPEKVQMIVDWPIPTSVTEVHQFLGLTSYYRQYIQNFANVAVPLYSFTQANMTFSWNESCTSAFEFLKHCLMEAPVLVYPSFSPDARVCASNRLMLGHCLCLETILSLFAWSPISTMY